MPGDKISIGNVDITSFSDGSLEFDLCNFFPSVPGESWRGYEQHLTPDHKVSFNLASFLVRSEGHNILVDTGLGPKPSDAPDAAWGELLDRMAAGGLRPEDIDMVVLTHLHRDHVGWNLLSQNGRYTPTFPRARYWMSAVDLEASHRGDLADRFPNAPDCVWPLEGLGLVELMEGEHRLTGELTTLPTPGHTPGHMSILVSSQGETGLIMGDAVHNPAQVHETEWSSRADIDPDQARATRRSLMERLERDGIPVAAGHFPAPGFGRIVRLEGRRQWQGL